MVDRADTSLVRKGHWGLIRYATADNGIRYAEEFIAELDDSEKQKIARLFIAMSDTGSISNRQKFKKVEGRIFEFKCHQIRIGCFQERNVWLLTHGFIKKQDHWPRSELEKAIRIMTQHQSSFTRS